MKERQSRIIYSKGHLQPDDKEKIKKSMDFWRNVTKEEPILTNDKDNRVVIEIPNKS